MKVFCGVLGVVLLGACATESSVVMPEALTTAMRDKPTAVLFTDDVGSIRLIFGKFNAPGFALPGPQVIPYGDSWDASPPVTAVHTQELSKLGFRVTSAYTLLGEREVSDLTATGRADRGRNYEIIPVVTPALATALQSHGQLFLLWVTWSGLEYFHTPVGQPVEQINSSYWLFDLSTRSLVWSGGLADIRDSSFKYAEAEKQLEGDQFATFKRLVEERYHLAYRPEEDSVPWLLGLVRAKR